MTEDQTYLVTEMLNAVDAFMGGEGITDEQKALNDRVQRAGVYAYKACELCPLDVGGEIHALTRTFLLALIDPLDPELDYLCPSDTARNEAREKRDQRLEAISPSKPDGGKTP